MTVSTLGIAPKLDLTSSVTTARAQTAPKTIVNAPIQDSVQFSGKSPLEGIKYDELQEYKALLAKPFEELLTIASTMLSQDFADKRQAVVDQAKDYIKDYLAENPAGNPAIAMDLDETLVNNVAEFLNKITSEDSGGVVHMKWLEEGNSPAIPETLAFFNWAKNVDWTDADGNARKGVSVFFVTARKDKVKLYGSNRVMDLEASTVRNLERLGINASDYSALYLKPADNEALKKSGDFKEWAYKDIQSKGNDLVLVMGDQDTDFQGFDGYRAQLPNPMY